MGTPAFRRPEVIWTGIVVVAALVGTAASVAIGSEIARTTAATRMATRTAAALIEELRAAPFDELVKRYDGCTREFVELAPNVPDGGVTVEVAPAPGERGDVLRVVVTAHWDEDGEEPGRLQFATYVSASRDAPQDEQTAVDFVPAIDPAAPAPRAK